MLNSIQTLLKIFLMWKWHLKTSSTIQYKILLTLKCAWHSQWGGVICSSFRDKLIIDMNYINKQITIVVGFNIDLKVIINNINTTKYNKIGYLHWKIILKIIFFIDKDCCYHSLPLNYYIFIWIILFQIPFPSS